MNDNACVWFIDFMCTL